MISDGKASDCVPPSTKESAYKPETWCNFWKFVPDLNFYLYFIRV